MNGIQIDSIFILHLISTICWTIVYLEAIRVGFKDKTYCIPFIALSLNLTWEIVNSISSYTESDLINLSYICWSFLDAIILITYFKYGKKYFPNNVNIKLFLPWSFLILGISILLQILFTEHFGASKGRMYTAFIQNLIMSILFLNMLRERNSTQGQNLTIAVNKLIGTLMATITYGLIGTTIFKGPNPLLLGLGVCCFIFDTVYIWLLYRVKHKQLEVN